MKKWGISLFRMSLPPIDAREALKAEADKLGADIYVMTSGEIDKKVRATAVAYKKK